MNVIVVKIDFHLLSVCYRYVLAFVVKKNKLKLVLNNTNNSFERYYKSIE